MPTGEVVARFETLSPLTVQSRVLLEVALAPDALNAVFKKMAKTQYEKELLFSTTVAVMTDVVLNTRTSVRQSFLAREEEIPVSITALYDKLRLTEVATSEALVRHSYGRLQPVVEAMGAKMPSWVPGYEVKIIDGNCLAATEHRLEVIRDTNAGPLPGKGLVIYDTAHDLVEDTILCEDGHASERSLFDLWLEKVKKGELYMGDRFFCTTHALFGVHDRDARFLIRQHATNAPWEEAGPRRELGRVDTGMVYEQSIRLLGPDKSERKLLARRVTLVLDVPTRDKETEIHILTDLTRKELDGCGVAEVFRKRWTIEGAFLHLAMDLHTEIKTLGYPPAALFGFAVGLMAYNIVSTMKGSIRAEYGQAVSTQLSGYTIAHEIGSTYKGMMVALPPETWEEVAMWSPQQVGEYLRKLAQHVSLKRFKKAVRGPKKPRTPRTALVNEPHVSTARLLRAKSRTK